MSDPHIAGACHSCGRLTGHLRSCPHAWVHDEPRREPGPWQAAFGCQNPRDDLAVKVWSCDHWLEHMMGAAILCADAIPARRCTAQDAQRAEGET
jgi:hypothetical protein